MSSSPATDKIRSWRESPLKFAVEAMCFEPDPWQVDALQELSKPGIKRLALAACAGPGKTALLAIVGWHRLACYAERGEHPKGIAVSCSYDNLETNLWPEMAKWQQRSEFLKSAFTWTKTRIFCNSYPATWILEAKGFAKSADPEAIGRTLSGLHSKFAFYLIDEAGDTHPNILRPAEQGMTTVSDGLILVSGNCTSRQGALFRAAYSPDWRCINISADPDNPKRTPRVSADWAREQISRHGIENPWVMAYILGKFPEGSINALLTAEEIKAAFDREPKYDDYHWSDKRLGVDVARFGDDQTVIFPRQGIAAMAPVAMRHQRSHEIGSRVIASRLKWGDEPQVFVDATGGYGGGVIDYLHTNNIYPNEVQFAGGADDPKFANKRTEIHWRLAQWIKRGGCLPPAAREMAPELEALQYYYKGNKLQLIDKDQIKALINRSPDMTDALACTFATEDQPARSYIERVFSSREDRTENDWHPLDALK